MRASGGVFDEQGAGTIQPPMLDNPLQERCKFPAIAQDVQNEMLTPALQHRDTDRVVILWSSFDTHVPALDDLIARASFRCVHVAAKPGAFDARAFAWRGALLVLG